MPPLSRLVTSAAPRLVARLRAVPRNARAVAGPRRLMSSAAPKSGTGASSSGGGGGGGDAAKSAVDSSTLAKTAAARDAFMKEREAVAHHAGATAELWRKFSLYGVPVVILLCGYHAYNLWNEHWEHWAHMPPLEERVEYAYQNIRTKNYQWGDGDKTLFWNDSVNYHNKDKAS